MPERTELDAMHDLLDETTRNIDFRALPILRGYLATMLQDLQYSESDETCEQEREARDTGTIYTLCEETYQRCKADCETFLASLPRDTLGRNLLDLAIDYAPQPYSMKQAGADLYLTRAGHGTGFWDRGLGPVGEQLTVYADRLGRIDPYVGDDGNVYL